MSVDFADLLVAPEGKTVNFVDGFFGRAKVAQTIGWRAIDQMSERPERCQQFMADSGTPDSRCLIN